MGGKSTPDAPDYRALAEEQAKSSRAVTEQQTWANRPTQNTPWGQVSWEQTPTWDPATEQYLNQWTQNMNLTPEEQASVSAQQRIGEGRSNLAESLLGRTQDEFGQPMDWGQLPEWGQVGDPSEARQTAEDALYGRATSRLDPQWEKGQAAKETQLWNQGLRPGDAAYDRAMEEFNQAKNDAYQQAQYGATIGGGQEATAEQGRQLAGAGYQNTLRQSMLAEDLQQRGFSLNEINAILHGQQVGMPQMPGFNQANASQATQYSQAGRDQFGADSQITGMQNASNPLSQGMGLGGQLGAAYLSGGMSFGGG